MMDSRTLLAVGLGWWVAAIVLALTMDDSSLLSQGLDWLSETLRRASLLL